VATDCLPCHFEYEEQHVLPYLPPIYRRWLLWEHKQLKEAGYPAADVIAHSQREVPVFRRFCPAHLVDAVVEDHRRFHPVLERCAHLGIGVPTSAIV
jgi:hypothetical protein